jgi:predicted RNase H-like HicB family nuclease
VDVQLGVDVIDMPFHRAGRQAAPSCDFLLRVLASAQRREHAMHKDFNVVIERDSEGYYVASVSALRGCHTQARSPDDLMLRIREAIELCLEAQGCEDFTRLRIDP